MTFCDDVVSCDDIIADDVSNQPTRHHSGILVMGVRLMSHWTVAAFTGLLFIPR
jgi:hypothetical protein